MLCRPSWLVSDRDGLPARRQSPIQVLTGPTVEQLRCFTSLRSGSGFGRISTVQIGTTH